MMPADMYCLFPSALGFMAGVAITWSFVVLFYVCR